MKEKARRVAGPATHPSCAIAHASDRTPDPITAVTMCALAVHTPPATIDHNIIIHVRMHFYQLLKHVMA